MSAAHAQAVVCAFENFLSTGEGTYVNFHTRPDALIIIARAYTIFGLDVPCEAKGISCKPVDPNTLADW